MVDNSNVCEILSNYHQNTISIIMWDNYDEYHVEACLGMSKISLISDLLRLKMLRNFHVLLSCQIPMPDSEALSLCVMIKLLKVDGKFQTDFVSVKAK